MSFDYTEYDNAIFVDASGDDGFNFENSGTSLVYAVGCFSCLPSDIEYNTSVLIDVKKAVRCNPKDEIKSSTIVSNRFFSDALKELSRLKGCFVINTVFKTDIPKEDVLFTPEQRLRKSFSAFHHTLAMDLMQQNITANHILYVVDNMKSQEVKQTKFFNGHLANFSQDKFTTRFSDSKASDFILLQIVDILTGIYKKGFEEYYTKNGGVKFNRCCTCRSIKKLCRNKPHSQASTILNKAKMLRPVYMMNNEYGFSLAKTFIFNPSYYNNFWFLDCIAK